MLDDLAIARALHVAAVVHWIGGVFFVTLVVLPGLRRVEADRRVSLFDTIERGFAWQARISTLIAGLTGFYMLLRTDAWYMLVSIRTWWIPGMLALWAVFTLMLFVLEPLVLHRWFDERAARDPEGTFALVLRLHRVLSTIAAIILLGGVAGTHGLIF